MSRYLIIGCSGSGKSTFARKIAESCDVPYHDADSLYWGKGWKLSTDEEVVASLPLDSDNWVTDGNFTGHRCEVWKRATSIVWLDFPVGVIIPSDYCCLLRGNRSTTRILLACSRRTAGFSVTLPRPIRNGRDGPRGAG
jgi:hypothetical protein